MTADEKAIIQYLKGWPHTFVSGREIARKVGGKERYNEDRGWALPILVQMVRNNSIETDHLGYYRLKIEDPKRKRNQTYVSPQLLRVLKSAGKSFETFVIDEDNEEGPVSIFQKPAPPAGNKAS